MSKAAKLRRKQLEKLMKAVKVWYSYNFLLYLIRDKKRVKTLKTLPTKAISCTGEGRENFLINKQVQPFTIHC